jgi:hypothetical protein
MCVIRQQMHFSDTGVKGIELTGRRGRRHRMLLDGLDRKMREKT